MKINSIINDSIVDGPGFRLAVFFQGCPHGCAGCHNPSTHDMSGGKETGVEEIVDMVKKNPLLDGVTLTGGEPFIQAEEIIPLAEEIKKLGLNIVAYSGYTYEELISKPECRKLLSLTDTLVDGRFVLEQRTLDIPFVGSSNQKVLDMSTTMPYYQWAKSIQNK